MSLLFRLVRHRAYRGTHQKLAVDALRLLRGEQADRWRLLFLTRGRSYLQGAIAPDERFRDFRNHVLYVAEGGWGGIVAAAEQWYQQTVEALRRRRWSQAAFAAGVLSHYLADATMPLHTGQSEAGNNIQRACEWSVFRTYDRLLQWLEGDGGGFPTVELSTQEQWLKRLLTRNAAVAHAEYDCTLREYDFERGVKRPAAGLSDDLRAALARLLGVAIVSQARVLERALTESEARPPWMLPRLSTALKLFTLPAVWPARLSESRRQRQIVRSIHREFRQTGRVETHLPEEIRRIREAYRHEVRGTPTAVRPADGSSPSAGREAPPPSPAAAPASPSETPRLLPVASTTPRPSRRQTPPPKFHLELDDPVADVPAIGPKTARKLQQVGIPCVEVLLEHSPSDIVALLETSTITVEEIRAWQQQARLMCQVPGLGGHAALMLVACGIASPEQLAEADPAHLHQAIVRFVATPTARRLLRPLHPPDKRTVREWVRWAVHSRPLRAA
jgi:predicted flap endonuclease-1-like 5' DNA nuclease